MVGLLELDSTEDENITEEDKNEKIVMVLKVGVDNWKPDSQGMNKEDEKMMNI